MPRSAVTLLHRSPRCTWLLALLACASLLASASLSAAAPEEEAHPDTPAYAGLHPLRAPAPGPLLLAPGDRLAVCGDSITEQLMYSQLIEDYLTMCTPDLRVAVRPHGWSGETAEGFLRHMKTDCLVFKPAVATLCYGMNDYRYMPYDEANAQWYRQRYGSVVETFKAAGVKVVLGSPGCVGKVASWVASARGTLEQHNQHLCALRNLDIGLAAEQQTRFADVFWPLFRAGVEGRERFGAGFNIAGNDGVHPGWAGHLVMAYAYLRALGLDGDLGTVRVDLAAGTATASGGHEVGGFTGGELTLTSHRYPFCVNGAPDNFNGTRAGTALVPFFRELSRLTLVVTGGAAAHYKVTWGGASHSYPAAALAAGTNLAEDFPETPFAAAWAKVDAAVHRKQVYENHQAKELFRSPEMQLDPEGTLRLSEGIDAKLVAGVAAAFAPVQHTLKIEAE